MGQGYWLWEVQNDVGRKGGRGWVLWKERVGKAKGRSVETSPAKIRDYVSRSHFTRPALNDAPDLGRDTGTRAAWFRCKPFLFFRLFFC